MATPIALSPRGAHTEYISPLPPKLDTTAGARSHIFQPPQTPASPCSSSTFISSNVDGFANGGQKRARHDSESYFTTPYSATASGWSNVSAASSILRSADAASPAPLVNTRYTLAGGLDTPGLAAANSFDGSNTLGYEVNFRRRWSVTSNPQNEGLLAMSGPLVGERNGKRRYPSSPNGTPTQSWSQTVLHLAGAVAGKMWEFCRTSAFRGFYAGGGAGYVMAPAASSIDSMWEDTMDTQQTAFAFPPFEHSSTPVPGDFPSQHDHDVGDDYGTRFIHRGETPTPPRPAKRLHTDTGSGWVMVDHSDSRASSPRLSTRRTPSTASNAATRSQIPRPVPQRPQLTRQPSSRRSLIPVSRRSSLVSHAGSPALHPADPASFASARAAPVDTTPTRPASRNGLVGNENLSPDAQKYAARLRREEREADKSLRKLNARLKEMVREGRQALGSRVEIVEDGMEMG